MIKINRVLICLYLSCYIQYYQAQSNTEPFEQCDQHPFEVKEEELDDFSHEEIDFLHLHAMTIHKIMNKKTRYSHLKDKCRDYGIMILIYYLQIKEQWHTLYTQFKKKVHKLVSFLMCF